MNARRLLKKAENGDAVSQVQLGYHYGNNTGGVRKSYKKAFYWYKQAAELGNLTACYNLGLFYLSALGTERSYENAFKWTLIAAQAGETDSMIAIGWHYYNGVGVERDVEKARFWYSHALEKEESRAALISLGEIGYDCKQYDLAKKYFEKSIAKYKHPKAYYYLGRMYFDGKSVKKNVSI